MIELITGIGVGIVIGMYVVSQIKEHILCSINQKKLIKNLKKHDKKKDNTI